jgi:signal transduction histidine kinase/ActR/RegA family two-component response regulator
MAHAKRTSRNAREDAFIAPSLVPIALLQMAIDRDPDAVSVMDRSLRFIAVNAAWTSNTGIGKEAIGHTPMELFGASVRVASRGLGPALAGREVIKTVKNRQDGSLRQITMTPWRDETGKVAGVMTRRPTDDSSHRILEGRERRLNLAMQMAKVFAFEIDFRAGEVTYEPAQPNRFTEVRIHGYEDALARLPEAEREKRRKAWDRHLATGELMVEEFPTPNIEGGMSWHRSISEAVRGDNGDVVGIVGVAQFIDEQKQAELALIAEKEAAQTANRVKSEFLANMSHEIRTPLTSIIGFADLLQRPSTKPKDAQTYIQRIASAGQSLLTVINDVLDFSKLEAGQVELDPHPFDPATCVQGVIDLLAAQAANKGLELTCDLASDLPTWLEADSARIGQVLINLVGNAVKFTEAGRITVAVRYEDEAPGRLRIAVTDTGSGVTKELQERLFQRFSQADGSISRRHGGSGLGLAICKSLVELMGGTLEVESQVGEGSTFWFAVPAGLAAPAVEPTMVSDGDGLESRPAHILVVDDVAANRELVRAMLTPLGHSFEEADNGADAVKAAMRSRFDLILMDLQMPGMDGLAAARAIRATAEANRDTPILAFSANVLAEHTEAALAAGMNDHISKPIQPIELLTKVVMWTALAQDEDAIGLKAVS